MFRLAATSTLIALSLCAFPAHGTAHPLVGGTRTGYAQVRRACAAPAPGQATCFALVRTPVSSTTTPAGAAAVGARPYTLGDGAASAGPAGGLTPSQLASAYSYDPSAGGSGQTVAIVDAYDDPEIESDLAGFDSYYGLPSCTSANGCFTKVGQTGTASLPAADETGWSVEISLDVETVHASCHNCKILLVEANSASFTNLATAVDEAVSLGATEVSNSYGGPEAEVEEAAYNHPGLVITAATGDFGYDDWSNVNEGEEVDGVIFRKEDPERPNIPASLPTVVAVGGTTLKLNEDGSRASETIWNGNGPGDGSEYAEGVSGGGCSTIFTAQLWQRDMSGFGASGCGTKRLDADVSAVADPYTGLDIYDSYKCSEGCPTKSVGGWITVGGTSLSTPLIASLYGLSGGSSGVRYPALTLYGHVPDASDLYDVTQGANGFCGGEGVSECNTRFCSELKEAGCGGPNNFFGRVDCEGTTACNAATGFDGPSGVGTPNGLGAFQPLLPTATVTAPASPKAGVAASFSGASSGDPYPGGSIAGYSWNWGDGTPGGSGVSPAHTFTTPGEYQVTLTVTDNYGLTSLSSTQSIQVVARTSQEIEEEVAAKKKAEEEAAAKKKKAEEEAAAKKKNAEEEAAAKKRAEEEAAAKKKGEEEAAQRGTESFKVQVAAAVPDVRLESSILDAGSAGTVKVRIGCPARESRCVGTVSLRTVSAIRIAGSQNKSVLALANGSFSIPGGGVEVVTLHLSPAARRLLARSRALRVRASLLAHDPAGAVHAGQEIVQLRLPGNHRG